MILLFDILVLSLAPAYGQETVNLKAEFSKTLLEFCNSLRSKQLLDYPDTNFGAIKCTHCNVLHTRAAEAVYPFSVAFKITGDTNYLNSSLYLTNWLINQQQIDGSWKETPEEWTGTTTDQLLMLVLTYNNLNYTFNQIQKSRCLNSITKAADYLTKVMDNSFASINYCATTSASLAAAYQLIPDKKYIDKAKHLAWMVVSKMDEEGFINGEGGKVHNAKFGVDLGYNLEMSLWGLGYYAMLTGDQVVNEHVLKSLKNHLYFIYPDGSMDNSWGIRSNKWTTYGSVTSDGCQVLFTLFAEEDLAYSTAAFRNLQSIRASINNGVLGYGPHYSRIFSGDPCIYPTFAKAKNLALAYELAKNYEYPITKLPTDQDGWLKEFTTLDLVELCTKSFVSTITAYRYKDVSKGSKSKYMYRPTGGSISTLFLRDHGYLQASSQTEYIRWEPMHFPEASEVKCLTPRIEYKDSLGYFTNLFEYDARVHKEIISDNIFKVVANGELKDKNQLNGGVGYKYIYEFSDSSLVKSITLFYRNANPEITIVEPIIDYLGMEYSLIDSKTVEIKTKSKLIEFKVLSENAKLVIGRDREKYWSPFPSIKAFPIELVIKPGNYFTSNVSYAIRILDISDSKQ